MPRDPAQIRQLHQQRRKGGAQLQRAKPGLVLPRAQPLQVSQVGGDAAEAVDVPAQLGRLLPQRPFLRGRRQLRKALGEQGEVAQGLAHHLRRHAKALLLLYGHGREQEQRAVLQGLHGDQVRLTQNRQRQRKAAGAVPAMVGIPARAQPFIQAQPAGR